MRDALVGPALLPRAAEVSVEFDGVLVEHHLLRVGHADQLAIPLPDAPPLLVRVGDLIAVRDPEGTWLPLLVDEAVQREHDLVRVRIRPVEAPDAVGAAAVPWKRRLGLTALASLVVLTAMPPLFVFVLAFGWGHHHADALPSLELAEGTRALHVSLIPPAATVEKARARAQAATKPRTEPPARAQPQPMRAQAQAQAQAAQQAARRDEEAQDDAQASAAEASHAEAEHRELDAGATTQRATAVAQRDAAAIATATARAIASGTQQAQVATAAGDETFARLMNAPAIDPAAVGALHQIKDASSADAAAASAAGAPSGAPAAKASDHATATDAADSPSTSQASGAATSTGSAAGGTGPDGDSSSGLGMEGIGAGGGGDSIELGNLGTIGRGGGSGDYGVGHGEGGLAGRESANIRCFGDRPNVRGAYDRELVRRVMRAHQNEMRHCYARELPLHRSLTGRVELAFRIEATGLVSSAEATPAEDLGNAGGRIASCVAAAVRRFEFPRVPHGATVSVSYPYLFHPLE